MLAIMLLATAAFTIASADTSERTTAPTAPTATFTIAEISTDPGQSDLYFRVVSSADVDGDSRPDAGLLRISCSEDKVTSASYRYHEWRWNDAASQKAGKPSPELTKRWAAASPELGAMKVGYDIKTNAKGRAGTPSPTSEWSDVTLSGATGLCGKAARAINLNSSKSN